MDYLFTSKRLGFRLWQDDDLNFFDSMNSDGQVMKYFPNPLTRKESERMLHKFQRTQIEKGYCYYATEVLQTKQLIGMIGLGYKDFDADFTPCVDIGWRLHKPFWGNGYATEGAAKCLDYAFMDKGFLEVMCIAPSINTPSIQVMKKIGLRERKHFNHPQLLNNPRLENCVHYGINASEYQQNA